MHKPIFPFTVLCAIFVCVPFVSADEASVHPDACAIVLPKDADPIKTFAAEELAKHIARMTGVQPPVGTAAPKNASYIFHVGVAPRGAPETLANEQACYKITKHATWLWGEDKIRTSGKTPLKTALILKRNRTGTLFSVYFFLENQFGVRWVEPGDPGIVCPGSKELKMKTGAFSWTPPLLQRHLRPGAWWWKNVKKHNAALPKAMRYTRKESDKKYEDELLWLRRQRMGSSIRLNYGHAFTKYWEKYGREHPEWFALQEDGRRGPEHEKQPDRVKLCVSNPELRTHIVQAWLAKSPSSDSTLNACENDSAGFCRCKKCRALDVPRQGEEFDEHLTDRYVWFANQLIAEARKSVPGARAVMYAYSCYRYPPRREKLSDGLVIGLVPGFMGPRKDLEDMYTGWLKVGAKEVFLRPNDMWIDLGIPMGFGKRMFENFQIGMKYGLIGTDYDRIRGFWETSGLANYALARAQIYPERSFEDWQKEYCLAYGSAAGQVEKYFDYWRENPWPKLVANRKKISEIGQRNFRRGLGRSIDDYYSEKDFDVTDAMLVKGLAMNLDPAARSRLKRLFLANRHGRLTFRAMAVMRPDHCDAPAVEKWRAVRKLHDFRIRHRKKLHHCWPEQFRMEKKLGDLAGQDLFSLMNGMTPIQKLPEFWKFRMDPQNVGLKEHWQKLNSFQTVNGWSEIRIDAPWEQQNDIDSALQKQMSEYDGIGWYATELKIGKNQAGKKLFLVFGAVDESCIVYLDGREIHNRVFKDLDDWQAPFVVALGNQPAGIHRLVVRVEDQAGMGGIWKPVRLVSEE